MARNVEIKARAAHFERQARLAQALADAPPESLSQEDVFFRCPSGRLKLRTFDNGRGELISYHRPDSTGPAECRYTVVPVDRPDLMRAALTEALGVWQVVRKTRAVCLAGQTRIHLDQVQGLGPFIELEVVLRPDQTPEQGAAIARKLMERLDIQDGDLVASAYADLLAEDTSEDAPPAAEPMTGRLGNRKAPTSEN